jgi:hypothetical protein
VLGYLQSSWAWLRPLSYKAHNDAHRRKLFDVESQERLVCTPGELETHRVDPGGDGMCRVNGGCYNDVSLLLRALWGVQGLIF